MLKVNLRGSHFEIPIEDVLIAPNTRLAILCNEVKMEQDPGPVYLNKNPDLFNYILDYYTIGVIHFPKCVCFQRALEELKYWGLTEDALAPCCYDEFKMEEESQATLKKVQMEFADIDPNAVYPASTLETLKLEEEKCKGWKKYKPKIWRFLDEPRSSFRAQVWD